MESVVLVALEEVRVAIGVLQRCVQVVGNTLPVGDGLGIASLDRRPLGRIEAPELAALEEVNLAIAPQTIAASRWSGMPVKPSLISLG